MNKRNFSENGMLLISILMLTFLLVMLTTSMIIIVSENSNITGKMDKKSKALMAAQAGLEYALYKLIEDPNWSPAGDVNEGLGNDQRFTLIFNPAETYHSYNNLMSDIKSGNTPRYGAEIICKGICGTPGDMAEVIMKGIFLREELVPTPIFAGSELFISCDSGSDGSASMDIQGDKPGDPGRIHSNTNINLNIADSFDLKGGMITSVGTVTGASGTIDYKEYVPAEDIPDIKISDPNSATGVIENRLSTVPYHTLPPDTYYVMGYFEYDGRDPNNPAILDDPTDPNDDPGDSYCVPHFLPSPGASDQQKYTSAFRPGIIYFTEPNDCDTFVNNYETTCSPSTPGDLYSLYNTIRFWEYDPNSPTMNAGIGMDVSPDPNHPGVTLLTLRLIQDLYVSSENGLFDTTRLPVRSSGGQNALLNSTTQMMMDFDDHIIYGRRIYIGIPSVGDIGNPNNCGAIVSTENIDFMFSYNANLVAFTDKDLFMTIMPDMYGDPFTLNGYNFFICAV